MSKTPNKEELELRKQYTAEIGKKAMSGKKQSKGYTKWKKEMREREEEVEAEENEINEIVDDVIEEELTEEEEMKEAINEVKAKKDALKEARKKEQEERKAQKEAEKQAEKEKRDELTEDLNSRLGAIIDLINKGVEITDELMPVCPFGIDKYNAKTIQSHLYSALKRCDVFATRIEFLKNKV